MDIFLKECNDMDNKLNFELIYKTEKSDYILNITEDDYSLEFIENELIKMGDDSEFDIYCLSFVDYPELNKRLDNNLYEDFFQTYYESYLDLEVFIAGLELGIEIESIEDAYQGQYSSDAEFAENLTNDCYDLKNIPSFLEIDWESTASNIMYDYSEDNGYYFSNHY